MTETICTSGNVKVAAGNDVSTDITAADFTDWIETAEDFVCTEGGYDWVTNWGTYSGNAGVVKSAVISLAAMDAVNFDPDVWDLATSQTKLDVLDDRYRKAIDLIEDRDKMKKIGARA